MPTPARKRPAVRSRPSRTQYTWRPGARLRGDAQVVGELLDDLVKEHGGQLRPGQILKAATPKGSPLHGYFEWNDKRAANKYRLSQAGNILRALCIVSISPDVAPMRAYVVESQQGPYVPSKVVFAEPSRRTAMALKAMVELTAWRRRWQPLAAEMRDVFRSIDDVIETPL